MEWIKGLLIAFLPSMFFGKIGFASAFLYFGKNFPAVFTFVVGGAFIGSSMFTYLSERIFDWWNKRFPSKLKQHKIRKIRKIIKVKQKWGLSGIAFLAPVLLSYPGGCFIAVKFFKNPLKIILSMTLSASLWTAFFYFFFDKIF